MQHRYPAAPRRECVAIDYCFEIEPAPLDHRTRSFPIRKPILLRAVTGTFRLKSSSAFAKVKRINMILISPKEISLSSAPHIADFRDFSSNRQTCTVQAESSPFSGRRNAGVRRARLVCEEDFVAERRSCDAAAVCWLVARQGLLQARLCPRRRNAGELDTGAARFSHYKMDLGTRARPFRRKLDHDAGPCRDTCVQCLKRAAVHNLQCKMMQTDVATAVERHAFLRILDLPERHDAVSVSTRTTPDNFGSHQRLSSQGNHKRSAVRARGLSR